MATHYPHYPAPHGWAPPYQGAAPPMPAGVSVNATQWNMGSWAFNPAYNAQRYPAPQPQQQQQWMPARAWGHAYYGQHIAHPQQQQQQAASFNPYRKVIKPPSAEYLATRLTNNGLDLHNMVPIADPHGDAEDPNVPKTPWIWNPATLQNDAPSVSAQRKALAEASNRAAGPGSLTRHASEPAVSSVDADTSHLATPRPRHHATNPLNQPERDEEKEGFSSKGELKPTFSPKVIRTHHSRSSTSSLRQSSISSASNSTSSSRQNSSSSSRPVSRHSSMPSIYSSQSASKSSSSIMDGAALTDEPSSILSPLSAILMVPEDEEPDSADSNPTPRVAIRPLGGAYNSFSSQVEGMAEATSDRTTSTHHNNGGSYKGFSSKAAFVAEVNHRITTTDHNNNTPYNHTTASQSQSQSNRRQAPEIYAQRTPRTPTQDTHAHVDTRPSSSTHSQHPSRGEYQAQGQERDGDRDRDRDRSSHQQQQQYTPPEPPPYPPRRPDVLTMTSDSLSASGNQISHTRRPSTEPKMVYSYPDTTGGENHSPYPISSNPHYNVSPSGTTPGYKGALSSKPLSGVPLLPKPPPTSSSMDPYTSRSTNPHYNIDVDDDMRHIPPEVMERREREFAEKIRRQREQFPPSLPAIIPMPDPSGKPDNFSYSSSYTSASASAPLSSSSFPRTPTRGHSFSSASSSSQAQPVSHEEPRPTPIKLKNIYMPVMPINPRPPYRLGYWNKRGDHVTKEGFLVYAPPGETYPPELAAYPEEGNGYKNELGLIGAWDASRPELPESLPKYGMAPKQPYRSFVDAR
ncbi:hypothetical protein DXG03_005354 [Asterophora parasitica]|uniref:Uncharacterized protein n=1 Tax=Asterophora parasitica TaxID=117018 RepID=A0A9P7FZI4_9AGAR|nr:hypothetical protein DXG03_005354 [Asterophora parasitica]